MADGKRGPYHGQYKQEHFVLENNAAELYCLGQICSVIPSQAHREVRWAPGWPSGSQAVLAVTRWLPDPGAAPYPWWDMKACEQILDPSQQALSPVTSRGRSIPISCFSVPTQHTEGTKVQRAMQGSSVPNERGFRWGLLYLVRKMLRNGWGESILHSSGFTRCLPRCKSAVVSAARGKPEQEAGLTGILAPGSSLTC